MSLNLVSPGVKVREVDLTIGRVDATNDQVGAIAGPFQKGPVNVPILIETEQDLLNTFGKPLSTDGQYEYWLGASSYLSYGGILRVVRADATTLNNANAGVSADAVIQKIQSYEDYINNYQSSTSWYYAARNPGSWANNLKVCIIDAAADQRVAIGTFGLSVGYGITVGVNTSIAGVGTVNTTSGYLKGIITKVGDQYIDVKVTDRYDSTTATLSPATYTQSSANSFPSQSGSYYIYNTSGVSTSIEANRFYGFVSAGSTIINPISLTQNLPTSGVSVGYKIQTITAGIVNQSTITGIGTTNINGATQNTILISSAAVGGGIGTNVQFVSSVAAGTAFNFATSGSSAITVSDWYNDQTLGLTNSTIYWKSIAEKPNTSEYASGRNSKNDEIHVVVVDDTGVVTGIAGNIVEKYTYLSKALDGKISPSEGVYYKDIITNNSNYIFAGFAPNGTATGFISGFTNSSVGNWGTLTQGTIFSGVGNVSYNLTGGVDYSASGGMSATLANVMSAYDIFSNPAEYSVNFLINGPSGGTTIYEAQAKANKLISIAEVRKDCIAVISPYRGGIVNLTNTDTQTTNIINFFDAITSSSYAVFDSGYKYTFDRFNNTFRYIACNSDIAGLMAKTSINQYPWFSPAGSSRGAINGAVKLAYNPSQAQRDLLYPKRINPIIFSPGAGIILFGDKTALSYASAFDRINVRRLFLTLESTIERAARAQLFEFNDQITRSNFINIVEPYLRDVKGKRGITDFLVVCDETNNTPAVIDSNQFRADIFVKPARSINFIGLTFVATRTGVSFEEVVGNV